MSFVAFTVGCVASSACLYQLSLALDDYSASSNARRYRGVLEAPQGPSALNWSTYSAGVWTKGEHPKFTDLRRRWNGAVRAASDKALELFDVPKK